MKSVLIMLVAAAMAVGLAAKTSMAASFNPTAGNGYITLGRNVVILPQMLQRGDKIALFNIQGRKVLEEYVGKGYLEANVSKLPRGLYTIVITRKNTTVAVKEVPIMGSMKG